MTRSCCLDSTATIPAMNVVVAHSRTMFCCHALLHDVFASNSTTAAMHACPSMLSAVHVHTGVLLHNALVAASPSLVAGGSGALTDTNTAYSAMALV
jgi:hypothetical protein